MKKVNSTADLSYLKNLHPVKVIKVFGDLKKATIEGGKTVHREEKLWMGQAYGMVMTASYDNHFIFDDPDFNRYVGRWTPMCTCGGFAGVVGSNAYKHDASPTSRADSTNAGQLIVCLAHAQFGKHADGSS